MLQIFPTLRACDVSEVYTDAIAPDGHGHIAINVVTTVDGRVAVDGGSQSIGSDTDHKLMRQVRALHDAVLYGAGTLRGEKGVGPGVPASYEGERRARGMVPQPLAVVLGGHGELPLRGGLARLGPEQLVIFLPEGVDVAGLRESATVYTCAGSPLPDPREVVHVLRELHGASRLLLEGGSSVYASFLRAGLVDEIFWTLAPKLAGGDAPGMLRGKLPFDKPLPLSLTSVHAEGDELYLRYAVRGTSTECRRMSSLLPLWERG